MSVFSLEDVAYCLDLDSTQLITSSSFLKTYSHLKGNASYSPQLLAVAHDLKPAMDDWVPIENAEAIINFFNGQGLIARVDTVFEIVPSQTLKLSNGSQRNLVNTTSSYAHQWEGLSSPSGLAHIFIAKREPHLKSAVAHGWYPVVINNTLVSKPWIDHGRFGLALGYPTCCVENFQRKNNWNLRPSYIDTLLSSETSNPLINPFAKHSTLSYIVHIPCTYSCRRSIQYAESLRSTLNIEEPKLVPLIDSFLRQSFLHISENQIYWLYRSETTRSETAGSQHRNSAGYEHVRGIRSNASRRSDLLDLLQKGNYVEIHSDSILVKKDGRKLGQITIGEQPHVRPFLFKFEGRSN